MYDEVYIKETNKMAERYPGARKKKTDTRRERDASAVEKTNKNSIELCSTCIVSVLIYKKSKSVRRTRERTSDRLFLRYGCFAASVSLSRLFFERFFQSLSFLSFFLSLSLLSFSLSLSLSLSFSILALSRASFSSSFLYLFMRCYCYCFCSCSFLV